MLQKLKELEAEAEDDEEIVSGLIAQADSDNINDSRDHIIKKSILIPVLICQIGYNISTIVHFLVSFSGKRIGRIKNGVRLEKMNLKITWCGSQYNPDCSSGIR